MAVYAEWLPTRDDNKKECSNCRITHLIAQYPVGNANFCPNCGAIMNKNITCHTENIVHCKNCTFHDTLVLSDGKTFYKCKRRDEYVEFVSPDGFCDHGTPKS